MREDPATGSAAGPLMALLHAHAEATAVRIAQGIEMGRASALDCAVEGELIRVDGSVVVLVRGTLVL